MSVLDFAPYESGVKYTQRRKEKIQSYCEMTIKKNIKVIQYIF